MCPEGHDPSIPGSEAFGCIPEHTVVEICTVYVYEDLTDHLNNMQAVWAKKWFEDNLSDLGFISIATNGRVVINNR